MKIKWQISDGYAGTKRPQYIEIDDYTIQECENVTELEQIIEEAIQEAFEQRVFPHWDRDQVIEDARRIMDSKEEG